MPQSQGRLPKAAPLPCCIGTPSRGRAAEEGAIRPVPSSLRPVVLSGQRAARAGSSHRNSAHQPWGPPHRPRTRARPAPVSRVPTSRALVVDSPGQGLAGLAGVRVGPEARGQGAVPRSPCGGPGCRVLPRDDERGPPSGFPPGRLQPGLGFAPSRAQGWPTLCAHSPGLLGRCPCPGLASEGSSPHPCPGPRSTSQPL